MKVVSESSFNCLLCTVSYFAVTVIDETLQFSFPWISVMRKKGKSACQ